MKPVKNSKGKTICFMDEHKQLIEILKDGIRTIIQFMPDGTVKTSNIIV